jgi:hypothetical protein
MINNINILVWVDLSSKVSIEESFTLAAFDSDLVSFGSGHFSIGYEDGGGVFASLSVESLAFFQAGALHVVAFAFIVEIHEDAPIFFGCDFLFFLSIVLLNQKLNGGINGCFGLETFSLVSCLGEFFDFVIESTILSEFLIIFVGNDFDKSGPCLLTSSHTNFQSLLLLKLNRLLIFWSRATFLRFINNLQIVILLISFQLQKHLSLLFFLSNVSQSENLFISGV